MSAMVETPGNIVLIGPMGAGKSTVGRLLAARLGCAFTDTDHLIEDRCGADIPWIFDVEGEAGFRLRETHILETLQDQTGLVIATGGGIVTQPGNLPLLKSLGQVIYLTASIEQLFSRTRKDRRRPLLQVADPRAQVEALFRARDPIYREVADWVLDTSGRGSKWVAQRIFEARGAQVS